MESRVITKGQALRACGAWTWQSTAVIRGKISDGAARAYAAICSLIYSTEASRCSASEAEIAGSYGKTRRTFRRHLRELVNLRLILVEASEGRISNYALLDPRAAKLRTRKRSEVKHSTPQQPPEMKVASAHGKSKVETEPQSANPEMNSGATQDRGRTKLSAVSPVYPYSNKLPKEVSEKKAIGRTRKQPLTKSQRLAIAFLDSQSLKSYSIHLLGKHGAPKILYVKRQIEARRKSPKNPPGLTTWLLRQSADPALVAAHSNEILHTDMKTRLRIMENEERRRRRTEENDKSIEDWLNEQPDKEEIVNAAEREVKFTARGAKVDFQTLRRMVTGYLWRERQKRAR